MILTPAKIVAKVREKAASVKAWADLSNFVFDQETGILAAAFPNIDDRRKFGKSAEYREIWQIIEEVQIARGSLMELRPWKGT